MSTTLKRRIKHIKDIAFILSVSKIQVFLKPEQETLVKSGLGMIWYKHKSKLSYPVFSLLENEHRFYLWILLSFASLQNLVIYTTVKGL